MTDLVVRRLLIDLQTPLPRHWCGGDAFRTAFFNALSMSFPVGEQFFIDSVRNGLKALPADEQDRLQGEVQGFIGQEATHRRMHALYNAHLEKQGLVNAWAPRAESRMKLLEGLDPRHPLAITAANEHFTAILAEWLLRNPDAVRRRRAAPENPVAVAQRRRVRAQNHRLRAVPGARRQPGMARQMDAPRHLLLPDRYPAPDAEQPAARRHAMALGDVEDAASFLFGPARAGAANLQTLARLLQARLPSRPAAKRLVAALAAGQRRPIHPCRRTCQLTRPGRKPASLGQNCGHATQLHRQRLASAPRPADRSP